MLTMEQDVNSRKLEIDSATFHGSASWLQLLHFLVLRKAIVN